MSLDTYLRRTYKISEDEYDTLSICQGHVCAICKRTNPAKNGQEPERLSVDHNHRTGENRGLLCQRCNRVLGMLEDSQELTQRILEYLRRHDGPEMSYPKLALVGMFDHIPLPGNSRSQSEQEDPNRVPLSGGAGEPPNQV